MALPRMPWAYSRAAATGTGCTRQVGHFERNARMDLVHLDGKLVLDALHRQVLAHRLELVADVAVVVLRPPLFLEQLERLDERRQRSNRLWIRRGSQTQVGFSSLVLVPTTVCSSQSITLGSATSTSTPCCFASPFCACVEPNRDAKLVDCRFAWFSSC